MKTAFVFPGQGSQYVGMAQDLVNAYPQAREVFEEADAILGGAFADICFKGPENVLTDTLNAQPALLTHSVAVLRILQSKAPDLTPDFTAGHSLGEYSALVAADALDFADAVVLVRERGRVMKAAGEKNPGLMAAVLGMDAGTLDIVCQESGVQIANYNAPGQIVISGARSEMERAIALAKDRGAKRVLPLAVSIASHSRWMESAASEFAEAVARTPLRTPRRPVMSNVTAEPLEGVDAIREEMVTQLTASVQWTRSVEYMAARQVTRFVEIGPKDVLAGLVRRITKDVHAISIGDVASVKAFIESKS